MVDVAERELRRGDGQRGGRARGVERRRRRVVGFRGDIRNPHLEHVGAAIGDVPDPVRKIPLAGDVPGWFGIGLEFLHRAVSPVLGLTRNESDRRRIGRPDEMVHPERAIGDPHRFCAGCRHHDELGGPGVDLPEECEHRAVRRELRRRIPAPPGDPAGSSVG